MELLLKKCMKCGALVEVIKDCTCQNCGITCCGEQMLAMKSNSVDASFEKHVPQTNIKDGKVYASVNHVMEEDHYIEFLAYVSLSKIQKVFLKPGDEPKAVFEYLGEGTVYSYCNKHALWETKIN